jgi:5-oxoprolinase (ATP-hydrolysing) subunit A
MRIDLNADMGESFGPWRMGDDAALLDIVTSASIACGFHAGDPVVMAQTVALCRARGVGVGAHPGFADLQGFGRRRILGLKAAELRGLMLYQIGALAAIAAAEGAALTHVKPHGALNNMASADRGLADGLVAACRAFDPALPVLAIAGTALEDAARAGGGAAVSEVFADRAYNPDGTLVDRARPGAMIHDPGAAADHVLRMVETGHVRCIDGTLRPVRAQSVCVHGDGPGAVRLAERLRARLEAAGVTVAGLARLPAR